jgi:hypothetical protein
MAWVKASKLYTKQITCFKLGDFCEFGLLIGISSDLRVPIDYFVNGDARLGCGLLKYDIFRSKSQNLCV